MTPPPPNDRFLSLLEGHKGVLYKVANAYCRSRDDRPDLIQEMLLALYRSFPSYDDGTRFSTWMYRVAMNVAISFYRSGVRHTRGAVPLDDLGIELSAADRVHDGASDDVRLLERLVAELDPLSRAMMILYMEGHSHEEIGAVVGISSTNAKAKVSRHKATLQERFDSETRKGAKP